MGDRPATADPAEPAREQWLEPGLDLLILTDDRRRGRYALRLPFRDATVLELALGETPDITGEFAGLAIDRTRFDLHWLATVTSIVAPGLGANSPMIVILGSADEPAPPPGPGGQGGGLACLHWCGLGTVAGRPYALLRVADDADRTPEPIADLLVTADQAARLASGGSPDRGSPAVVAHHLEGRRQSEHALLRELAAVTSEWEREKRRPDRPAGPVRDLLRRSRVVRRMVRAVRRGWLPGRRPWARQHLGARPAGD